MAGENSGYRVSAADFTGEVYRPNTILQNVNMRLAALEQAGAQSADKLYPQLAYSDTFLTLTTTPTAISGTKLTLPVAGSYYVRGVFDFQEIGAGDLAVTMSGYLKVGPDLQTSTAIFTAGATTSRSTVSQQWLIKSASPGTVVQLFAAKVGGTGTSNVQQTRTGIYVIRVSD